MKPVKGASVHPCHATLLEKKPQQRKNMQWHELSPGERGVLLRWTKDDLFYFDPLFPPQRNRFSTKKRNPKNWISVMTFNLDVWGTEGGRKLWWCIYIISWSVVALNSRSRFTNIVVKQFFSFITSQQRSHREVTETRLSPFSSFLISLI